MRILFVAFGLLSLLAVVTLYVLAEHTDRYFAWTVNPPLTAAFLGAGYGAGVVAILIGLRRGLRDVRLGIEAILVFVGAMSAATFLHLDLFHLDASGLALAAAWVWVVVYVVVPVWIPLVLVRNRVKGRWSGPAALPPAARTLVRVQAAVLGGLGAVLFLVPVAAKHVWAWPLSPLTARAVAAWLLALSMAAVLALAERDVAFLEVPALIFGTVAVLKAVALLRFHDQVTWATPAAWLLVMLLAVMLATGVWGTIAARRARHAATVRERTIGG